MKKLLVSLLALAALAAAGSVPGTRRIPIRHATSASSCRSPLAARPTRWHACSPTYAALTLGQNSRNREHSWRQRHPGVNERSAGGAGRLHRDGHG